MYLYPKAIAKAITSSTVATFVAAIVIPPAEFVTEILLPADKVANVKPAPLPIINWPFVGVLVRPALIKEVAPAPV